MKSPRKTNYLSKYKDGFSYHLNLCKIQLMVLVQFSCSVLSDSLQTHEPQHARPPCPSPTPRVYPNSCPLSRWCHPAISSSVIPFCSCPQSFPASGSFPMSQLFASGGQSTGRFSMSLSSEHSGLISFRTEWFDLFLSKGLSRVFSSTTV